MSKATRKPHRVVVDRPLAEQLELMVRSLVRRGLASPLILEERSSSGARRNRNREQRTNA